VIAGIDRASDVGGDEELRAVDQPDDDIPGLGLVHERRVHERTVARQPDARIGVEPRGRLRAPPERIRRSFRELDHVAMLSGRRGHRDRGVTW
jgi:hypothetical protein